MADRELMYFNGPGRGECIRLILHAGSVSFKDTRGWFQIQTGLYLLDAQKNEGKSNECVSI